MERVGSATNKSVPVELSAADFTNKQICSFHNFCSMMLCGSVDTSITEKSTAPLFRVRSYQKYNFKLQQGFILDNSQSLEP
jgi:hypothetical protein